MEGEIFLNLERESDAVPKESLCLLIEKLDGHAFLLEDFFVQKGSGF